MIPRAGYGRRGTRSSHRRRVRGEAAIKDVVFAVGLLLAFEGLLFAAFPTLMRKAMRDASEMPEALMRMVGVGSAVLGIGLLWLVRSLLG